MEFGDKPVFLILLKLFDDNIAINGNINKMLEQKTVGVIFQKWHILVGVISS